MVGYVVYAKLKEVLVTTYRASRAELVLMIGIGPKSKSPQGFIEACNASKFVCKAFIHRLVRKPGCRYLGVRQVAYIKRLNLSQFLEALGNLYIGF